MKRSMFSNFLFAIILFMLAGCHGNPKITKPEPAGKNVPPVSPVYHDTINKKTEIRNDAPDQQKIDSIKDEKTRRKKML